MLLTFWGPNKKTNETTIQVNTSKGSDKRFVNLFCDQFIKPVIDKIFNGTSPANYFKKKRNAKISCDLCENLFIFKIDFEHHM